MVFGLNLFICSFASECAIKDKVMYCSYLNRPSVKVCTVSTICTVQYARQTIYSLFFIRLIFILGRKKMYSSYTCWRNIEICYHITQLKSCIFFRLPLCHSQWSMTIKWVWGMRTGKQVLPQSLSYAVLIVALVHLWMDVKITYQLSGGNYWWRMCYSSCILLSSYRVDITPFCWVNAHKNPRYCTHWN